MALARELSARFVTSKTPGFLDTAGWVEYRSGNIERAVELLEQAAALLDEPVPEQQYHLGMAYLAAGRKDEGRELLEAAIESGGSFHGMDTARAALSDF
jgi:tetratricopeptide (TPR) repeat protein